MGMFDEVDYECVCPVCHTKVSGFQSKDGDCVLAHLTPADVDHFYSSCGKCGCWIQFNRIQIPTENFKRTVKGKLKGVHESLLNEYTKDVKIQQQTESNQ